MTEFDVLAVPGLVPETIHVEPSGSVTGRRIDAQTGGIVTVIGCVVADDTHEALAIALEGYVV
jgi:hypothetical protein